MVLDQLTFLGSHLIYEPFKMYKKDHVEEMIVARLSVQKDTDYPDWLVERQFKQLYPSIEVAMNKVLWNTNLREFTEEDLVSLMLLKAHQILRQGKYDFQKNSYSYFYTAFTNLMLDIVRASKRKKCGAMSENLLDYVVGFNFNENVHISIELEGGVV